MPSLTIKPPRPPSERSSSSPSQNSSFTFSAPPPSGTTFYPPSSSSQDAPSPVAPAYSPITPKVQPVLPAIASSQDAAPAAPAPTDANTQQPPASDQQVTASAIPPTEYIPQPPPQPFSSEDSTDAIALRAAISALQFQKKKARDDLRTLETTKRHALDHPQQFKDALIAGKLKEQRHPFGGVQAILDEPDEDDGEEDAGLGAEDEEMTDADEQIADTKPAEVLDSQPSQPTTSSGKQPQREPQPKKAPEFPAIPGAQNVVRMPHINWEKYHVLGDPLDRMHEQQRRWPGSTAYGQDRGREHAVAAPYSPFHDHLEAHNGQAANAKRNDSFAAHQHAPSPTGTVSEHPMETRRSSKNSK
ncbi:hypothetical protein B0A50_01903 [Salinomyces thailandicus]|uniref:Uncharacterized protein n=1 Tax=Salinomyces thailandicus TaxID=706561 RepID=A0A4U0U9K5_9PEZI|nr:hypothetical protein B0A50_01903 [Salinomyces thailandica]